MSIPNLGNLILHAAALVDGAGAILNSTNIVSVVRNGLGDYTFNLGTEIDNAQRHISLTPGEVGTPTINGVGTDSTINILTFNPAGAAADVGFSIGVFRTSAPS